MSDCKWPRWVNIDAAFLEGLVSARILRSYPSAAGGERRGSTGDALASMSKTVLVVTCEHGGREVPPAYARLFGSHGALLQSHRGWDAGSLELARQMAEAFGVPLHAATTTRLLVDLNRSPGHRRLFSEVTRALVPATRQQIVERYHRPHRQAVEAEVARHIAAGRHVIHVASHSFTPTLDGVDRRADVAWLYDPRRAGEVAFARDWMAHFARHAPGLRLRRNHPYRGRDDGLTAWLRKRHPDDAYVGIELEVNQRFVAEGGAPWDRLRTTLIE
jgi:predicted N-formylglutamate amidohydrolase